MGLRAYFLVNAKDDVEQKEFVNGVLEMEEITEVDFVDPVVGDYDVVVMIEAPVSVEKVARKIEQLPWVKELKILKITSIFERHRASKKELLQSIVKEGL